MLTIANPMPSHTGFAGPFLAVNQHGGLDRPMTLSVANVCCEERKKDGVSGRSDRLSPPISGVARVSARVGLLGKMQLTSRCRSFGDRYCGSPLEFQSCEFGNDDGTKGNSRLTPAGVRPLNLLVPGFRCLLQQRSLQPFPGRTES
jgi:hypothetical protein